MKFWQDSEDEIANVNFLYDKVVVEDTPILSAAEM